MPLRQVGVVDIHVWKL